MYSVTALLLWYSGMQYVVYQCSVVLIQQYAVCSLSLQCCCGAAGHSMLCVNAVLFWYSGMQCIACHCSVVVAQQNPSVKTTLIFHQNWH